MPSWAEAKAMVFSSSGESYVNDTLGDTSSNSRIMNADMTSTPAMTPPPAKTMIQTTATTTTSQPVTRRTVTTTTTTIQPTTAVTQTIPTIPQATT